MRAVVIIPARYGSTRLPGKPILEIAKRVTGKYIVQHVYDSARQAPSVSEVIVATDDENVAAVVKGFGGRAVMTSPAHLSGSDRVAEVAQNLDADVVVNLQCDEPEVLPEQVEQVIRLLADEPDARMSTLAFPITSDEEWTDPNVVKVVCDERGYALYFSRSPIPYPRDTGGKLSGSRFTPLRHVGIYGYRKDFLMEFTRLPQSMPERVERLEQLRALCHGARIRVGLTNHLSIGIDTEEDLHRWLQKYHPNPQPSHEADHGKS